MIDTDVLQESGRYFLSEENCIEIKNALAIVKRLEETYHKFGKLSMGEMTINSWTPGRVCSLLEYIHGDLTDAGGSEQ